LTNKTTNTVKHFITGGAGFVGSHLVDRLIQEGEVTVYDNLASGRLEWIQHHLDKANFKFLRADITDFESLKQAMAGHDIVWHLAANTDIRRGNEIVDLDLKHCTIGTFNVLEAMRQNGISQIAFTSSATIYGEIATMPTPEDCGPLLPISLYGAGKLAGEGLISAYSHLFGFKAWIYRFANVVGNRMSHGVIYDFIQKLRRNPQELEILGDGTQEKPFFLAEDCIEGMLCALQNYEKDCDVYNLGTDSVTRVSRVAEIVVEEMGLRDVEFKYTGGKRGWPGDVSVVRFDVSKMRWLGWEAKHTSDEAVRIAARRLLGKEG